MTDSVLDVNRLTFTYEVDGCERRLIVSCHFRRAKGFTPHIGEMLLFLDTEASDMRAPGRDAKRLCERNLIRHRLFDLVSVTLANDVSFAEAESRIRQILEQTFGLIKLEEARLEEAARASAPSSRRVKPERRTRVHAPLRVAGTVGLSVYGQ